jgi:hypothetical protein
MMRSLILAIAALCLCAGPCAAQSELPAAPQAHTSKAWRALALAGIGVAMADASLTKAHLGEPIEVCRGGVCYPARTIETNPLARPFVHLPAPVFVGFAAANSAAASWLGARMRRSRHGWERRIWWLPQTAQIAGNAWGVYSWVRPNWRAR